MALSDFGIHIDTKGFLKAHIDGNSGHTFSSSVEELIHNSIDAEANNIYILKDKYGSLIIVDDGIGMDNNNIKNLAVIKLLFLGWGLSSFFKICDKFFKARFIFWTEITNLILMGNIFIPYFNDNIKIL